MASQEFRQENEKTVVKIIGFGNKYNWTSILNLQLNSFMVLTKMLNVSESNFKSIE